MKVVGIREFKNRLSEYIRLVRTGERVIMTDHGDVVAELRPPAESAVDETPYPALMALVHQGKVRLGAGNNPSLYPSRPLRTPPGTAAQLLHEERGER
jgi:prevent-host-death family protein